MISTKITSKGKGLQALVKRIKQLSESSVESGVFAEQGQHPTADMSYVDLAAYHATGAENNLKRDIRLDVGLDFDYDQSFKNTLLIHVDKYLKDKITLDSTLDSAGWRITDLSQSYFGVPSINNPDNTDWWATYKGGNSPLVHEGHLRDAWSYRTSTNSTIRGTQ